MSPVFLYLAIVVMWLCVLVPMWLRRDKSNLAEIEEFYAAEHVEPVEPVEPEIEQVAGASLMEPERVEEDTPTLERTPAEMRHMRARHRAIIVARRRRLLFFCTLLMIASVITAAVKIIPWWGIAPSIVVMGAYMTFLRIATGVDRERRQRAMAARAERQRRIRERRRLEELAAQQAEAEIIEFTARQGDVLFDQYAEPPRRAVGD
ncbi:hypothetical protein ACIBG8_48775 [Nonomuraea sp. NPDC050556]|uniref:divisome protein SepX/GlpR n=1 Tax=Nonomuraea sp. NPDC050556 TaxID=3364369 RepID=UPI0037B1F2CC